MVRIRTGIDISTFQTGIDWNTVKSQIDFVMIRGGYSQSKDALFESHCDNCEKYKIPYGVYWFSYAHDSDSAKREAEYLISLLKGKHPSYPIAFDFEEESFNYVSKKYHKLTANELYNIAYAFLSAVEKAGYYAMLYTNKDFLNRGFNKLVGRFDIWLAAWTQVRPHIGAEPGIWQFTSKGKVNGIPGNVDKNYAYKDYPDIITKMKANANTTLENVLTEYTDKYISLASSVISGKYGNGEERKNKLKAEGYDAEFVQAIVNTMV